jgi:hypothetical protein
MALGEQARQSAAPAQRAGRSGPARAVAQLGWIAKGVVYLALSWLVFQMARGQPSEQASSQGALAYLAGTGPGGLALGLVAVGLVGYAVGRLLEATTLATAEIGAKEKAEAVGFFLLYGALAASAFTVLSGSGSGSGESDQQEQQGTAFLLGLPFGRLLVGGLGLAVAAGGVYAAVQGLRCAFMGTLRTGKMGPRLCAVTRQLGRAAYVVKGGILVLFGGFLVQAAATFDPNEAKGLDGALREVADVPAGRALLVGVAVGLLAYALFCLLEARYRRVGSSVSGLS